MDLTALKRNKVISICKYCGWEGFPWQSFSIYEVVDWKERSRTPRIACPKCLTLDSMENTEYENIEDHPLLIENQKKYDDFFKEWTR